MPIHREGEFLVSYDLQNTPTLYVESSRLEAYVSEARRRRIPGLGGCPRFGFSETNLDVLRELPWLQRVWFWDVALDNVDGLYALQDLRDFGVHPRRPGIDCARLPQLRSAVVHYSPRDANLDALPRLASLHLWHFNPRAKHFGIAKMPACLEELEINWANPTSLAGLPHLPRLRTLGIHRCRNLESLAGLPEIAPNLEKLIVTTSGRLREVDMVGVLPRLRVALVSGRSVISAPAV